MIEKFHQQRSNEPGGSYPPSPPPKPSWFRRLIVSGYIRWCHERLHATEYDYGESIKLTLLPITRWARRKRFDQLSAKYFDVGFSDNFALPEKFIFYALHYTPESSINGLAPYYIDQFRVIDALLLSLPPGYRLVVKEHPAMYGIRPRSFYRELRRRPGVVMAHPALDTRSLIARAEAVATVTGTIGIESYLLDKPCILFGRNFFSHLCQSAPALTELRDFLRELIAGYKPPSAAEKEIEIAKLVNIGGDFVIGDPWFIPTVMAQENIDAARDYLWRHLKRLGAVARA
jgi:CDP-glycerol glycerophosphotransferase (TagB/SpsB family)